MDIKNIISILSVLCFIPYILLGTNIKRNYLLFVLYIFPFIDLFVTPVALGGFHVFDLITYITLILLIKPPNKTISKLSLQTILFVTLIVLLALGSLNSEFVFPSFVAWLQLIPFFFYCNFFLEECDRHPEFIKIVIKALKISAILSLAFLTLQYIFGLQFTLYLLSPNVSMFDQLIRYPSFFQDPQKYGQFLAMTSFLFLIPGQKKKKFGANFFFFILIVIATFLTGSRASFLGLCVGLFIIIAVSEAKYKIAGITCFIIGFIIILFYSNNFALFNRESDFSNTANVRIDYWHAALDIFSKNPLFGIGIGNYQRYVSIHAQNQYWEYFGTIEYMDHPESGYLKLLTEYGAFASFIAFSLIIYPLLKATQTFLTKEKNNLLLFLTTSYLSWLIAFTTVYSFSDVRIFLLSATLICLMVTLSKSSLKVNFNHEL